ncbi:MAG TPA: LemA family protein, partial [Thermoanaerobaculia bacterium]|nr:LemA family protein [Thermoanaerobaculia bacterium]
MKRGGILLGCLGLLLVAVVLFLLFGVGVYNRLVGLEESVTSQWAQVENVYQRRADLIPNLVKTVEGAADFERTTLREVVEARARVGQMQLSPEMLEDPQAFARFEQAQGALSSALSRLMVVVERYPELKANQNFLELQSQLEGTENRIAVERMRYNQVAQTFNTSVRRFPASLIAGMMGFERKAYFQSRPGADQAPNVEFDFGTNTAAPAPTATSPVTTTTTQ